ncbi:helix-hairpin-helix domain-containing protein [Companilactobacillus sp.]|uniref:helix-hairpin-helix domain-containing protein n=1 Tax=Companilactobacillus sp. TaxID=2767905 RepID=UPI0025C6AB3A|nr:helix-hairpin-helix domain-containing protein [Companilactobacillus sp.]MCH4008395.1 helix-hairpin-helix domain-containing protein [Companilactobacillus sp.]MCH4051426.1 helix-hairpin-helix domain-containing protein [Companilactobacillus sp.]MCH4076338.1 helix-hairpin-helix domain-containing protein [Companilactobacillus sp.]MCH4124913.1 helix-hairpin-helix domain-containing protein [Companilactobacillus sp.]MCH4131455.1 helix-hairpin-helix domain-containing protein [Companilactobacillus sp
METIIQQIKANKWIIGILTLLIIGYFFVHRSEQKSVVDTGQKVEQVAKAKPQKAEHQKSPKRFTVDIQGEVKHPGVYRMEKDSIVQDVIKTSGGLNDNADIRQLNQAQKVADEMKIYIPAQGETVQNQNNPAGTTATKNQKVNINSAKVEDFKDVRGVGPKKAEKIIEYRDKNGRYQSLDDLSKVGGIGKKTIDSWRDQLVV